MVANDAPPIRCTRRRVQASAASAPTIRAWDSSTSIYRPERPRPKPRTGSSRALHTSEEPELALRNGGLYAKRIAPGDTVPAVDSAPPDHVLIIGGTGNLGLEFCDHFARRGARRITLVSRSGETATAVTDRLRQIRSAARRTSASLSATWATRRR